MALLQDPRLKRPGQAVVGDTPMVGGMPTVANPISALIQPAAAPAADAKPFLRWNTNLPNTPEKGSPMAVADQAGLQHPYGLPEPAPAAAASGAPAASVPATPLGTRVGTALRRASHASANLQVAGLNAAAKVGAGALNAFSYPARATEGFVRDTGRALMGDAPSANAGQPMGGITAPQLKQPFPAGADAAPAAAIPSNIPPTAARAAPVPPSQPVAGDGIPTMTVMSGSPAPKITRPGIDSGATVGNRKLNYGAMVDGVPTFSDGSGGPSGTAGSIPRTMSDASIADLGKERSISRADAGVLANPLASDVGGPASSEQGVQQAISQLTRPITGSRPTDEQFAAADRNAIASGDFRSAAGTAAHNLGIEAGYAGTPRLRRMAEQSLAGLQTGAQQSDLQTQQTTGQSALAAQQAQSALDTANLTGQYGLKNTAMEQRTALLKRPQQQVILDDGMLGIQDQISGQVTRSTMPDGSPAKALTSKEDPATKRTNEVQDQITRGAQELAKSFLPTKDQPEPTPEMIAAWREQSARAAGLRLGTDPATGRRVVQVNGKVIPL